MRALRFGIVLAMLSLTACATALPPVARVTDVASVAGTYSGTLKETGMTPSTARAVLSPDGSLELAAGQPAGFRLTGRFSVDPADGSLIYEYERGKGRGVVYEGDGRRVIVFTRADGRETITVDKTLP
jgi:hypothetical protein